MAIEPAVGDVLWNSVRDKGRGRLLFIARPDAAVAQAIDALVVEHGLSVLGRGAMFSRGNWHQSVSDRYIDTPPVRETLLKAGAQVQAPAFTLALDRLYSARNHRGTFNWDVRCRRGSDELKTLITAINDALAIQGYPKGGGHSPHITLSYGAGTSIAGDGAITPIHWIIDTIELVVGGGTPYHYTTLASWSLAPAAQRPVQTSLF